MQCMSDTKLRGGGGGAWVASKVAGADAGEKGKNQICFKFF